MNTLHLSALVASVMLLARGAPSVARPVVTGYAATNPRGVPIFSAPPGAPMLVLGSNLGTSGTVAFNGIPAPPAMSWSPTEILVTVPSPPSYPFRGPVTVTVNGQGAAGPEFTITWPPPRTGPGRGPYEVHLVAMLGDVLGGVPSRPDSYAGYGYFAVDSLNDSGQLLFSTAVAGGGAALMQYSEGKFTPIVVGGGDAPGGMWPRDAGLTPSGVVPPGVLVSRPVSMNESGNAAFSADVTVGNKTLGGIFLWNHTTQQVSNVLPEGMPGLTNLPFSGLRSDPAAINNHDEIAFTAWIGSEDPSNEQTCGASVLIRRGDGTLVPVALPGLMLPDGTKIIDAFAPAINDAGVVAFMAMPWPWWGCGAFSEPSGAYQWEQGTITPVALIGVEVPGGGKIDRIDNVWLNNKNRSVLVSALIDNNGRAYRGLYRSTDGKLTPVLVSGQPMQSGGSLVFGTDYEHPGFQISPANELGQHALLADLDNETQAVFIIEADGAVSLVLRTGTRTPLGTITHLGGTGYSRGVVLNSDGQVALTVTLDDHWNQDSLVLLTPAGP